MTRKFGRTTRGIALGALGALAIAYGGVPGRPGPASARAQEQKPKPLEELTFKTANGDKAFSVEVMRTDEERGRGLMYRRYMPEDRGMLFLFDSQHVVSMWMKNTYIPLDMAFVDKAGKIASIATDAEPLSEAVISSQVPVVAVVELNAGTAGRIGLKVGDRVSHPALGK